MWGWVWAGFLALALITSACRKGAPTPPCGQPAGDLHRAAWAGDRAESSARIEQGFDVNEVDEAGFSPLHWAVIGGQVATARLLLERGADPNLGAGGTMTPLHWAAMKGRVELIDVLLGRGARADAVNAYGMTALHEAANPDVVRALIDRGVVIDAVDERGRTALHVARNGDVAQALLERGADIRIRARDRRTALEVAVLGDGESHGLTAYAARAPVRLRGPRARSAIIMRNVTECAIAELVLVVQSPAAFAEVVPLAITSLAPAQLATFNIELHQRPDAAAGVYPLDVTVSVAGRAVGRLALSVDTRPEDVPEDRGMIRLGKGAVRPTPSRIHYLAFLIVPLLVVGLWWWVRRRARPARK